jgi:hypothetical protein
MKGFCVWMLATLGIGWIFGVLGSHPDPVRLALVLAVWLALSGGVIVYRDLKRVGR